MNVPILDDYFNIKDWELAPFLIPKMSALDALSAIPEWIKLFIKQNQDKPSAQKPDAAHLSAIGLYFSDYCELDQAYINPEYSIYLGPGVKIEPGVLLKKNCLVFKQTELRHTAYLRENSIISAQTVVGHCSEIKNSILFPASSAGHFNYIGDSLIGSFVNLGAGAKVANLNFRSLQDKLKGNIPGVTLPAPYSGKLKKFGSVVGDGCEIGCNAVLAPGVLLGSQSWVGPGHFLKKGTYAANSKLK